jgi:hypothetical protein
MKKTKLLFFITFLVGLQLLFSCYNRDKCNLSDTEKKKITLEIDSIVTHFFDAGKMSYEVHTALRANQEGYLMAGDGKIKYRSYQSYQNAMKESFQNIWFTEMKVLENGIYLLSRDAATCTTVFESKFLTNNKDTIINNGCWTFVFKKFEEGWKVIQENGTHTR